MISGETWQSELTQIVEHLYEEMVTVRRYLHMHPEPSGEEQATTEFVFQKLHSHGLNARKAPDGHGLVAESPEPMSAPLVAVRGDMDALRIADAKSVPYRSQCPGMMHACGHDAHTAMALGAVLSLQKLQERNALPWPVRWRGIFQPAEENSQGAKAMISAGALQDVGGIFSVHVDPSRQVGRIGLRSGALTASCDDMQIYIKGRGGHAARPHESLDPIATAAEMISSMYLFVPRAIDSQDAIVLTIGQIHGGDNPNVIPEDVFLRGTLRTLNNDVRQRTQLHIKQLAEGLSHASGTNIRVEFHEGPPAVNNDPEMTELLRAAAEGLLEPDHVETISKTSMGGEDFAFYLAHVPGSMFRLGVSSSPATSHPLHSAQFDLDENALRIGANLLARAAILWSNPQRHQPV